jgi:predicted nucleic acid-binding protein
MSLFVDTSIFYAAVDSSDKSNKPAKAILASGQSVLTSNLVLAESWNLINNKIGRVAAERFWGGVRRSAIEIETITPADFDHAWQTGIDWPDQDFSLVVLR